ncbi:MAG: hypothetical protein IPK97_07035 [Ahniella sp.]|nr:hypothetical protein [Ahniella sp.]
MPSVVNHFARHRPGRALSCLALPLMLAACAQSPRIAEQPVAERPQVLVTRHEAGDDLLTAGLGRAGLLGSPPTIADPDAPTAAELRRRAIYTNWRGIVDLVGSVGELPAVTGREYSSWRRVGDAQFPHRVLLQVPDQFDVTKPCLVVTASSGSRGIYGAIGSAGQYALSRGCAVVYTDKGAGTDWVDPASGEGFALDGRMVRAENAELFNVSSEAAPFVAFKHAHSTDNPEADWGDHVLQAAEFGLEMLGQAFPAHGPFTGGRTRVLGFGLSNGGGAVLQAAERDTRGLLDGVVAAAPNIHVPGQLSLYDIALEAAIFQPCLLLDGAPPAFLPEAAWRTPAEQRCRSLKGDGLGSRQHARRAGAFSAWTLGHARHDR